MQETDCRRDLPCTQQCCARRCGLSHDRQRGGIVIQPLYREAATLRNQFLQVLTTQANRTVWPTIRVFFPSISVCLGERRGKKEISNSRERNVPAPLRSPKHMNENGVMDESVDRRFKRAAPYGKARAGCRKE